jgi:hypothetical protein
MRFTIIILLIPSMLLANEPTCLLKTKQNTKYLVSNIEECLSMANALLGTEETYILRYPRDGFPNAGHEEIELSHVISTVRYIYKEPGLTTRGKINH